MARNILLSPIGRSPGAVTGIYYALASQDPPVAIDAVVLIATTMARVLDAAAVVEEDLGRDKVYTLKLRKGEAEPSHDFNDAGTVLNYIQLVNAVLSHARQAEDRVYIGISGGRSSMGALATLSAYVYGAAGIYHLWVDQEIEERGDISKLPTLPSQRKAVLNPPSDKRKLVAIPLAPFDDLWDRGRLGEVLAKRPEAREALLRAVTDVEMQKLKALQQQQKASFEDLAESVRQTFRNTELEKAVEAAIRLSNTDAAADELMALAEKLKPYFLPSLWVQMKQDLSKWATWKRGGDRLLKSVEAIGQPLAVAGVAVAMGIPKWA